MTTPEKKHSRSDNKIKQLIWLVVAVAITRILLVQLLDNAYPNLVRIVVAILIMAIGAAYILRKTANIIEETTEVLSEKTNLAGGLLQSFGTAFPDMVLGVSAAVISLELRTTDFARAINFAIIAAATTFGSNIYNIIHATWCIFQQNRANLINRSIKMFPGVKFGGSVIPMQQHAKKPVMAEIETAIDVSMALTALTAAVAVVMVIFGQVTNDVPSVDGDLYQLIRPAGIVILLLSIYILFYFRHTQRVVEPNLERESNYYRHRPLSTLWLHLFLAGVTILFAAESMVRAIEVFCDVLHVPFVIAGVLAGITGCLGEIVVVHNFTVNPNGRIGDAVVGVAMDNIVTVAGASIVSIMGGIFLGGNSLILIFVFILLANTLLIVQLSKMKNYVVPATNSAHFEDNEQLITSDDLTNH